MTTALRNQYDDSNDAFGKTIPQLIENFPERLVFPENINIALKNGHRSKNFRAESLPNKLAFSYTNNEENEGGSHKATSIFHHFSPIQRGFNLEGRTCKDKVNTSAKLAENLDNKMNGQTIILDSQKIQILPRGKVVESIESKFNPPNQFSQDEGDRSLVLLKKTKPINENQIETNSETLVFPKDPIEAGEKLAQLLGKVKKICIPGIRYELNELTISNSIEVIGQPGANIVVHKGIVAGSAESPTIISFRECSFTLTPNAGEHAISLFEVGNGCTLELSDCFLKSISESKSNDEQDVNVGFHVLPLSEGNLPGEIKLMACTLTDFFSHVICDVDCKLSVEDTIFLNSKNSSILAVNPIQFSVKNCSFEDCGETGIEVRLVQCLQIVFHILINKIID